MKVNVTFSYDDKLYPEIHSWLKAIEASRGNRSEAIREAIMASISAAPARGGSDVTIGDVYRLLLEIKRDGVMIGNGRETAVSEFEYEPAEIANNLDSLGL